MLERTYFSFLKCQVRFNSDNCSISVDHGLLQKHFLQIHLIYSSFPKFFSCFCFAFFPSFYCISFFSYFNIFLRIFVCFCFHYFFITCLLIKALLYSENSIILHYVSKFIVSHPLSNEPPYNALPFDAFYFIYSYVRIILLNINLLQRL